MKAETGDEARESGRDLGLELVPWKDRVLQGSKKGKDDPIHVLERPLWRLVEGGWKGPDHRQGDPRGCCSDRGHTAVPGVVAMGRK